MSDNKSSSGTSGGLGLTWLIGTLVSWFNTPSFTGWAGAGKAMLVGSGTSMGATIVAVPFALAGGALGAVFGAASRKSIGVCAAVGAVLGGMGGGAYGAVEGYQFAEGALTQPAATAPANNNATAVTASLSTPYSAPAR